MSEKHIGDYTLLKSPNEQDDTNNATDYFITKNGQTFAGFHLLIELWDAENLTDPKHIDQVLRKAAQEAGATILHSHIHQFTSSGEGVSGVVLLAESHISIHTWPERKYAAIDIFMCGHCDPYLATPILKTGFKSDNLSIYEVRRGIMQEMPTLDI